MIAWLLACAGEDGAETGDSTPTGDPAPAAVALTDASNYTYTLAMDVGATEFTPGDDGTLDWSALTEDLQGSPVAPASDVAVLDLVWFRGVTQAEVTDAIVTGALVQSSVGLLARGKPDPGMTSLPFTWFDVYGTPFLPSRYFAEPGGTWLLRVSTEENDSAMLHFLVPGEGDRTVRVGADSASLDFSVDLDALTRVELGGASKLDWEGLTRDGRGAAIDPLELQELSIGRYDVGVAELEERFFALESLAAETWTLNVYGEHEADLRDAVDASGAAFPGVDTESTWVLALRCLVCTTPAPGYLTVLAP